MGDVLPLGRRAARAPGRPCRPPREPAPHRRALQALPARLCRPARADRPLRRRSASSRRSCSAACWRRSADKTRRALSSLAAGMIAIAIVTGVARRPPDAPLEPGRPARDARPARRRLPPPAAALARVLHAHAHRRGAVADLERHRRRPERRHEHGDLDRLERDDGGRDGRRHVPAELAARAVRARADPALRAADAARRQGAAADREDDAGDARRHLQPGPGVALGLGDPARQDDGPRRRARRPLRAGLAPARRPRGASSGWPAAG